jgi:hypothetical protein
VEVARVGHDDVDGAGRGVLPDRESEEPPAKPLRERRDERDVGREGALDGRLGARQLRLEYARIHRSQRQERTEERHALGDRDVKRGGEGLGGDRFGDEEGAAKLIGHAGDATRTDARRRGH